MLCVEYPFSIGTARMYARLYGMNYTDFHVPAKHYDMLMLLLLLLLLQLCDVWFVITFIHFSTTSFESHPFSAYHFHQRISPEYYWKFFANCHKMKDSFPFRVRYTSEQRATPTTSISTCIALSSGFHRYNVCAAQINGKWEDYWYIQRFANSNMALFK